ncbi:MAG: nucleotidyltransferase domain-containing protein [Candidatus Pacearchaeota archaeon]
MITKNNALKIMELFFKYPERKFHLRELERLKKLSMPGVRKIVLKLEKENLLKSEKAKMVKNFYAARNEKFIQLKRAYNLYSIFDSGLLNFLKDKYEEPEAIVLFGSYSKGEDISKSDIDIAIITPKQKELDLSIFEKKLGRKIRIYEIRLEKAEKEFLNTLANGIILYGYLKIF